jgi:hypothetical protein
MLEAKTTSHSPLRAGIVQGQPATSSSQIVPANFSPHSVCPSVGPWPEALSEPRLLAERAETRVMGPTVAPR